MNDLDIKENVGNLIAKDEISRALDYLENLNLDKYDNEITLMQQRFNHSYDNRNDGLISSEDYNISVTKLGLSILEITDEITTGSSKDNSIVRQIKDKSIKYFSYYKSAINNFFTEEIVHYNGVGNEIKNDKRLIRIVTLLSFLIGACFTGITIRNFSDGLLDIVIQYVVNVLSIISIVAIIDYNLNEFKNEAKIKSELLEAKKKSLNELTE